MNFQLKLLLPMHLSDCYNTEKLFIILKCNALFSKLLFRCSSKLFYLYINTTWLIGVILYCLKSVSV